MKAQLLLRPPDEMKEFLRNTAKQRGQTMNQLILGILWNWINQPERHIKAARRERVKEVEQVSVGANIRTRREAAGLSQGYVARLAGIPHAVLCQIERGKKDPSLQVSREIAAVLCCKLDDLLAEK